MSLQVPRANACDLFTFDFFVFPFARNAAPQFYLEIKPLVLRTVLLIVLYDTVT